MYWYKKESGYIAFDEQNQPCYFVDFDKESDGYYWEDSKGYGLGVFDTAEMAIEDCEKSNPLYFTPKAEELTAEDIEYIKAERERQEEMESRLFGD